MKATSTELSIIASQAGLGLSFSKEGRLWTAKDRRGRVMWCGTLRQVRRVAVGKPPGKP